MTLVFQFTKYDVSSFDSSKVILIDEYTLKTSLNYKSTKMDIIQWLLSEMFWGIITFVWIVEIVQICFLHWKLQFEIHEIGVSNNSKKIEPPQDLMTPQY